MTASAQLAKPRVRSAKVEEIGSATILGVSASLKPGTGSGRRSAARSLLSYALEAIASARLDVALLDLRVAPPPFFDGRLPANRADENLDFVAGCVERAGALFIAVPAYWSGVSGVFKNFVDTLCGPAYDLPQPATTIFTGKPVALLVVGADAASAREGAREAPRILASAGARIVGRPISVSNPRSGLADPAGLSRELIILGGALARALHRGERGTC